MLQLVFAALLATAAPGPTPPQEEPKITITGDPVKDAPLVCLRMVSEKVEAALEGKPPISNALVIYSVTFQLSDEQKMRLVQDCSMFETGFMIGVAAERQGLLTKQEPATEPKGLTTTF